jgi:5-dehydro-4-deoxyglucarate dehydratase
MALTPFAVRDQLTGVFAFPVTPMHPDGSLHEEALRRQVRFLASTGARAVFACGGPGEFFSLSLEEYRRAVAATIDEVEGRLPVIAGTGYSTPLAIEFARAAERLGADGVLALPPYLIQPEQEGLYRHYRAIAERVGIGLILYHRDNAIFAPETVQRLAELPNVIGFKDGHGNLELFQRIRLALGERLAWMNGMPTAEMTFPAFYAAGARAYSSAIANFIPHVTMRFYQAVLSGDRQSIEAILSEVIEPLCRVRDRRRGYAVSYVKAAMTLLGLPDPEGPGPVRPPLIDLEAPHRDELLRTLQAILERHPRPGLHLRT